MTDFTELRSHAAELFKGSLQELMEIKSPDIAQQAHQQVTGYITGLNRLGVLNNTQYEAMRSLLESAMDAKKAAPSAANTESDKENILNSILGGKPDDVKPRAEAFVHADIYGADLHMETYGKASKLLDILSCYALSLRKAGIPEHEIQKAYLKSFMAEEGRTNA